MKRTLKDIEVKDKKVLVRADLNVPLKLGCPSIVSNEHRLRQTIPTIQYLLDRKSKVILCSHLGRPEGKTVSELSMAPIGVRLSELLSVPVTVLDDCIGPLVDEAVNRMSPGDVILLENLRFHPGEEANDPQFAQNLASIAEVFIMDAFGAAHRAHASTAGITKYLPSAAGFLLHQELQYIGNALESGKAPVGALLGGAKVSGKILLLENMLERVDCICIGGAMASTFLKARGYDIGASIVEKDRLGFAKKFLTLAEANRVNVLLPNDLVVAQNLGLNPGRYATVDLHQVPPGYHVGDIGPATADSFLRSLMECNTIIWNGPMGVFESPVFRSGTETIARSIAEMDATTIIGGGSTAEAVEELGLSDKMSHVSTGGGASLELLEGKELPGIATIPDK
jgi:phosphoglycerate kinase